MEAVILAGGLGQRLRPFTDVIPKPLLPLGGRALLEIQIGLLREHGFDEIYVATNYMHDYIEAFLGDGSKYGVRITVSREEMPLGTCGPIGLLRGCLKHPFLVMNGDVLTKLDFTALYQAALERDALLMTGTKIISTPLRYGNVRVDGAGRVVGVEEKPELRTEILAGIYVLQPDIFPFIPEETYFGMDQLIETMLVQRLPIARYLIEEYWLDIGQFDDYSQARAEYEQHFAPPLPRPFRAPAGVPAALRAG